MNLKNTNLTSNFQTAQKSKPQKSLIIAVIVFIVIACIAAFFYYRHQAKEQAYQADKARFAQVETDMKTAYDAMVAAAGVPDVSKQTKSCSNVSLKFAKGQLNCSVAYNFIFDSDTPQQSVDRLQKVYSVLSSTTSLKISDNELSLQDVNSSNIQQKSIRFKGSYLVNIPCELSMTFNSASLSEYQEIRGKYADNYFLICRMDMDKPIYPLAK